MKNKNTKSNKSPVIITQKTTKFTLLAKPEIAPKDMQPGIITEVAFLTGTENDKEFSRMEIVFQLDAKNRAGKHFTLTKSYNLGENGRGRNLFLNDYNSMTGSDLQKKDLYDFDPEIMKGMRVQADIVYSEGAKGLVATIQTFYPPQPVASDEVSASEPVAQTRVVGEVENPGQPEAVAKAA